MANHDGLRQTFDAYAAQGKGTGAKADALDNKNFSKMCKDWVVNKTVTSTDVDIVFSKHKTKGAQKMNFEQFKAALLELGEKKYKGDGSKIFADLEDKGPKLHGTTGTSKTGGVGRMTDASQYTGSHKERFDASGKGKGIEGRKDLADSSGYVGNYKGAGTYDAKTGK